MSNGKNVSAGVIVFRKEEQGCRFLLLLSRLTKRPLWEFPKGGVNPGESLLEAAVRELEEETGLAASDIRLVPGFERRERYRFVTGPAEGRANILKEVTYFLAEASRDDIRVSAAESLRYEWLDLKEALKRVRYPSRRRILEAAAEAEGCGGGTSLDSHGPELT